MKKQYINGKSSERTAPLKVVSFDIYDIVPDDCIEIADDEDIVSAVRCAIDPNGAWTDISIDGETVTIKIYHDGLIDSVEDKIIDGFNKYFR